MLLNLSQRSPQKLFYGNERARHLERGQMPPASHFEFSQVAKTARYEIGDRHFTFDAISNAHHCHFSHFFLLLKKLLDFPQVDIEAARNNQIIFSPSQRVVSIGRTDSQIAGTEITVHKSFA